MAELNVPLLTFSGGEMSNAALARIDQERLRIGCEIQENLFPHVIGKGMFRPGTSDLGATASNNKARNLRFVKSPTETALIEATSALMRVWVSDALVTRASVTSTVTNSAFSTASATVTITNASPAVVTWTAHGRSANDPVSFETTGALPTGLSEGTGYFVKTVLTADTFTVSATAGGAEINTSSAGSGTHTGYYGWVVSATDGATVTMSGGVLTMSAAARGSTTTVFQSVATSSSNTEHALRIVVTQGEVQFRCGSTSGGTEYISETTLGAGHHSLAFTPTASPYYIQFNTRTDLVAIIDSCAIEAAGTMTFTAPWSEADLPLIRTAQSLDVLFLACASWQPRKIERRSSGRSWSLVVYEPEDGPFVIADTRNITLTASAAQSTGTITASAPVFASTDVGRLVKITPPTPSGSTFTVAGSDAWSGVVSAYGIDSNTDISYSVGGTFVGTWFLQRSYDGETSGFSNVGGSTGAGTGSFSYLPSAIAGQPFNNIKVWYRLGFNAAAYTSGAATFAMSTNSRRAGIWRITGYTSPTQVSVQTLDYPGSGTPTTDWSLGAWSSTSQWPSAVAFFDGRIWWGGNDNFWASESDDYTAFNLDDEGASGSIQRVVATGGQNVIRWMLPLQRMILGASAAEVSIRSSSFDEPLSPTNITLKDAATQGAAAVSPVKIDGRGIYVHRDGRRLFELEFSNEGNDYRAGSLTTLNEGIGGTGILGIDVQRSPETYVWAARNNGDALVLLYEPRERALAWTKFIAAPAVAGDAVIEDVCVLPSSSYDRVYLLVKRTVNGATSRRLEKLALHSEAIGSSTTVLTDGSIFAAGPVTTFTGLTHLVGETVVAWGTTGGVTGPIGTTYTVNGSGEITLPSSSTNVTVGLAYTWRYKSAKLAFGAKGGTALLMQKRVATVGLLAENMHLNAVTFGSDFTTMYQLPRYNDGQATSTTAVQATWDNPLSAFGGGWDTDSRVCLKGSSPYPVTLNALVIGMATNEV